MPRPLVFGNGSLLLCLDEHYDIRELFYPHIGIDNHLSGNRIRMGVWCDGSYEWLDASYWNTELQYRPRSLVSQCEFVSEALGISLTTEDALHPNEPVYVRRIAVTDLEDKDRDVRVFLTQDLNIAESDIGDTVLYLPETDALCHFKGPYTFLFAGVGPDGNMYEYAAGISYGKLEGTWKDAEDGHLSMNPIAQGATDSVLSIRFQLKPGETQTGSCWITCGNSIDTASKLYKQYRHHNPEDLFQECAKSCFHYTSEHLPDEKLIGLDEDLKELARKSLLIMRTQCDRDGAIIAANDSDIMVSNRANYSYCWPRDGALAAEVFDAVGEHRRARQFFEFCKPLITPEQPFFLQKYRSDGTFGATWHPWIYDGKPERPFQEDETALTLVAAWKHLNLTMDREWFEESYDGFLKLMADHLLAYRDKDTGLPLPSYDLWEERRGIHAHTVGATIHALEETGKALDERGVKGHQDYSKAAQQMREAFIEKFYDEERKCFLRRLTPNSHGDLEPDTVLDASVLTLGITNAIPPDSPEFKASMSTLREKLWVSGKIGGMARNEDDYYAKVDQHTPGNPWLICTLWYAQCLLLNAQSAKDLEEPEKLLHWILSLAASTHVLPEQVDPHTGQPTTVSPLTWSHAECVKTCLLYSTTVSKLEQGDSG